MNRKLDNAVRRWRNAGPLKEESENLLLDLKEASKQGQPQDLIWAAFVRGLTKAQQNALEDLVNLVGREELYK